MENKETKKLDYTTQKPEITQAINDNERIVLSYDRHRENYELVVDTYEPIGYVEPFKEVIKRGLIPEMKPSENYGVSYKMETPVARVLRIKNTIAQLEKVIPSATAQAEKLKEFNEQLDKQLKEQETNKNQSSEKGESK